MRFTRHVAFGFAALSGLVGLSAFATTQPPPPVPSASAAPGASLNAPPRPVELEPLASQSIPKEASPRPTLDEWKTATRIRVTRRSLDSHHCDVFRVREWLKVKCTEVIAAIKQHGGNADQVFFWLGHHDGFSWGNVNGGEVILPMRVGDQRVIEFYRMLPEMCNGREAVPWIIVDENWVEGETSPTVVMR